MTDAAIRSRQAARGWITRAGNTLNSLCDVPDMSLVEITDAMEEFDRRISALDERQEMVEQIIELDQLDNDIEAAASFRDKARVPRVRATKLLAERTPLPKSNGSDAKSDISEVSASKIEAKLPKLELPLFSGDVISWTSFWEQFNAVVHNSEMPDITKFTYLLSLLKGDAEASVRGLALTAANYSAARDILQTRFGRPERIIFSHVQELLAITVPRQPNVSVLSKMLDDLQAHVRSLEVLGINGERYGVVLTPLILSRLPPELRMEWARDGEKHEGDLQFLLTFLRREIECRERSQTFSKQQICDGNGAIVNKDMTTPMPTAAALYSSSDRYTCGLCRRSGHTSDRCYSVTKTPFAERKEALRTLGACFRCLSTDKSHMYRNCQVKCSKCKGKHHALLCQPKQNSNPTSVTNNPPVIHQPQQMPHTPNTSMSDPGVSRVNTYISNANSVTEINSHVLLQAVRVSVHGRNGDVGAVVLFDTGSDKTYISKRLVNKIEPEFIGSRSLAYASFGNSQISSVEPRNMFSIILQGPQGNTATVLAIEIPVICPPMFRPSVPKSVLKSFGNGIELLDVPVGQDVQVDLIVGLDSYWKLMTSDMVFLPDGLVAQRSVFGWVLSGPMPAAAVSVNQLCVSYQLFCTDVSESGLQNFWDLDAIGICDKECLVMDPVLKEFNESIQFVEGRYVVSLPWIPDKVRPHLLDNEKVAQSRLDQLMHRLSKNPDLESRYHGVFSEMLDEGIIEEVPETEIDGVSNTTFYMPHRPVIKESSQTTKVRPVFDASAKGYNGASLNDCMETGPSMIPDLPGILLRFRRWKVALSADVTKAFHQIVVRSEDRDVHRFIWNDNGVIRKMRFVRVPFGNKCSPFLLNATIKYHLAQFPSSRVVEELAENLYVDDWLSGCDDDTESCDMLREANDVMSHAGMCLAKWSSNSEQVGDLLSQDFSDKVVDEESLKVLGMRWLAAQDCFSFEGLEVSSDLCITKRVVLSLVSRLFDPLGFLSPFIMVAKCLFQELWRLGLSWDEVVPVEHQKRFVRWISGLKLLRTWKIPRSYIGIGWRDAKEIQLQAFGDASESAYGACVYLRVKLPEGSWKSSLVIARARVAPLKRVTLPRLELLGALLCARLIVYVREALRLSDDVMYQCWTDSTVTLAWIQSDPRRWKSFVGNRVAEIQSLVSPSQWHHLPGKENPADLVTRGISAEDLVESQLWLHGPNFLTTQTECELGLENHVCSGVSRFDSSDEISVEEIRKSRCANHSLISVALKESKNVAPEISVDDSDVLEIDRWSSLTRAMRVVAWIQRYLHNSRTARDLRIHGDLSFVELSDAKLRLVKHVQEQQFKDELQALQTGQPVAKVSSISKLSPFLGEDGLIRVQGRLQFAGLDYEAAHPAIIPKGHLGVLLARQVHVRMKHASVTIMLVELRNQFWIVNARRVCKGVKRECVSCQRLDSQPGSQTMAPLPGMRVKQAPPFSITGLDYGGPLYCCDSVGKKFYILLLTCAVTRAIHLELVDSLSGPVTVLALRRFIARRGMPSVLMSDNAKGFLAAKNQLLNVFGPDRPEWRFIVPRAPWWGGWWERLIRSVKSALKRSLGSRSLTRVELETTLHEIEACVNSRPLTFVGDELDSGGPLTPSHFLLGRSSSFKPATTLDGSLVESQDLVMRHELRKQLLDKFWSCWVQEYLRNLPPSKGVPVNKGGVHVGSVVLVRGEQSNRLQWPLGVIQVLHHGRDGLVRSVGVKTAKGRYVRPIQCIYDLEMTNGPDVSSPDHAPTSDPQVSSDEPLTNVSLGSDININDNIETVNSVENECPEPLVYENLNKTSRCGRKIRTPVKLDL